jgi:hypothetical protein
MFRDSDFNNISCERETGDLDSCLHVLAVLQNFISALYNISIEPQSGQRTTPRIDTYLSLPSTWFLPVLRPRTFTGHLIIQLITITTPRPRLGPQAIFIPRTRHKVSSTLRLVETEGLPFRDGIVLASVLEAGLGTLHFTAAAGDLYGVVFEKGGVHVQHADPC